MFKVFFAFFFLVPFGCMAQTAISGRILNQADYKPIPNVNVFLNDASVGGQTAKDGTFMLRNAKPGKYELVVSIVGFETYRQPIIISNKDIKLPDITIAVKTITLTGVSITASGHKIPQDDFDWPKFYIQFKEEFLGTTDLAKECEILNPETIKLSYDDATSTLSAHSDDFIIIENKALGYKIRYLLARFTANTKDTLINGLINSHVKKSSYTGSAFFEELKGTPAQQKRWQKTRTEVYYGSPMHFLRSALGNRLDEEGFRVVRLAIYSNPERPTDTLINSKIKYYTGLKSKNSQRDSLSYWNSKSKLPKILQKFMPYPLNATDILAITNQKGSYIFGCDHDDLYISYNRYHHYPVVNPYSNFNSPGNLETTFVHFNLPFVFFGVHGGISNTNGVTYTGVWGRNRIAGLLPFDYQSVQNDSRVNPEEVMDDSTVSKNINARLTSFAKDHRVEKAYLHFDKPYYAAGDTMYFKAYVTIGDNHEPSRLSGVLHVDLINANNHVDQSIKLLLTDGVAWGDFALPDSLVQGQYHVRAYTQWMRNDGDAGFFNKNIFIGSLKPQPVAVVKAKQPIKAGIMPVKTPDNKPELRFFPEGGGLVAGIRSKVAFKAITNDGLGINVKGVIIDNENKEVLSFASTHLGMGFLYLDAAEGKTYKAKVTI